jgi:hypothetical protein
MTIGTEDHEKPSQIYRLSVKAEQDIYGIA